MHLIFTCERHILDHLSAAAQGARNLTEGMAKAVKEAMATLRFLHSLLEGDPSADVGAALAGEHHIPWTLNPTPWALNPTPWTLNPTPWTLNP